MLKDKFKTVLGLIIELLIWYCIFCVFSFSIAAGYVFPIFGVQAIAFAIIITLIIYRKNIIKWFKKNRGDCK